MTEKQHFMGNKTENMQYVLQIQQISLLPNKQHEFIGVFPCVFSHLATHVF